MNFVHSDFHVHTAPISRCAREDAKLENYIELAKEQRITNIGISNHFWDDTYIDNGDSFPFRGFNNLFQIFKNVPNDLKGINIYFGIEVDVNKDNIIGLQEKDFDKFDYILIATNHFHLRGFQIENSANLDDIEVIKKYQFEHIKAAFNFPFPRLKIICHPFVIYGASVEKCLEFLNSVSDDEYREIFLEATKKNTVIELHKEFCTLHKRAFPCDEDGFALEYLRLLKIANECGCKFAIGSDSHSKDMFVHNKFEQLINKVGIKQEDIIQSLPTSKFMEYLKNYCK